MNSQVTTISARPKSPPPAACIEACLAGWARGDEKALERLLEVAYNSHFLPLAKRVLRDERYRFLLPPRDLAHRAYLKLARSGGRQFKSAPRFFKFLQRLMRQALIDFIRNEEAGFRGGKNKTGRSVSINSIEGLLQRDIAEREEG